MKKLGLATALVLTLVFGAGSVFAQNSNSNAGGGAAGGGRTMKRHSRRHHRRHHRRGHRKPKTTGNTNS